MDINLTTLFDDFYHTRFFVLICLSLFTFFFSLRLDQTIKCSYWLIFLPLWIWKLVAFLGMLVGSVSWCKLSRRRFEGDTFIQYKAMVISFSTNLILFLFELIVCEKLESNSKIPWAICCIPLFLLSLISIGTCIWSIRYERSYEMELFCSLNILQFVFIALRLDLTITWSWVLVLIPLWIVMCVSLIVLLYVIILTIIMRRNQQTLAYSSHHNHNHQYRPSQKWSNVLFYSLFLLSLLTFEILLSNKLDHEMSPVTLPLPQQKNIINIASSPPQNNFLNPSEIEPFLPSLFSDSLTYFLVSLPLHVSYMSLMCLSFNSHSGNVWWFGMRRDFCELFLIICPIFKIYGNIQLKFSTLNNNNRQNINLNNLNTNRNNQTNDAIIRSDLSQSMGSTYSYPVRHFNNNNNNNDLQRDTSNEISLIGLNRARNNNNASVSLLRNEEELNLSNDYLDQASFSLSSSIQHANVDSSNNINNLTTAATNSKRIKFLSRKSYSSTFSKNRQQQKQQQQRRHSRNSSSFQLSVRSSERSSMKSNHVNSNYFNLHNVNSTNLLLKHPQQQQQQQIMQNGLNNLNKFGTIIRLDLPD